MTALRCIVLLPSGALGWLAVSAGIENGKAQLVIVPAKPPQETAAPAIAPSADGDGLKTVDELNEELFG